jgi:hypothetical protein
MSRYELQAACIRSGQVSAAQIAEMMKDRVFAQWYQRHITRSP